MRVRLTTEPDGNVCLESPYDRAFVDGLKAAIEYDGRSWVPERKRWVIRALYIDTLLAYLQQSTTSIQDDREHGNLLPVPPVPEDLRAAFDTLYLTYTAPLGIAEVAYKFLARHSDHADVGGTLSFHALNDAIATIRRYLDPQEEDNNDAIPF